ncbi:MAG: alkaline phosphatase [Victivallales bacterium]
MISRNVILRSAAATFLFMFSLTFPAADAPWEIKGDYPAPPEVDAAKLAAVPRGGTPRNIIFIIGDGMGQGCLALASLYAYNAPGKMVIDQFPVTGLARTPSADSSVTDSAASGTALSSGYKTNNGMIGKTPDKKSRKSFATLAQESGRSIGIMTTDALTGATPAAFLAHADHRSMSEKIASDMVAGKSMILIGSDARPFLPKNSGGRRNDGRNLITELKNSGYQETLTPESLREVPADKPVYGFIKNWDDTKLLSRFAAAAFEKLNANPRGFFIMVEGHYPDKGGHGNNPEHSVNGALMNNFLAKAALDFALSHPDTLIVVTADHETGGVCTMQNKANPRKPFIHYMAKGHTGAPVGVYAFGPGADRFNAVLENTDIPGIFADFWKITLDRPEK